MTHPSHTTHTQHTTHPSHTQAVPGEWQSPHPTSQWPLGSRRADGMAMPVTSAGTEPAFGRCLCGCVNPAQSEHTRQRQRQPRHSGRCPEHSGGVQHVAGKTVLTAVRGPPVGTHVPGLNDLTRRLIQFCPQLHDSSHVSVPVSDEALGSDVHGPGLWGSRSQSVGGLGCSRPHGFCIPDRAGGLWGGKGAPPSDTRQLGSCRLGEDEGAAGLYSLGYRYIGSVLESF